MPRGVPTWVSHRSKRRSQVNKTHQQDIYEEKEFVINHQTVCRESSTDSQNQSPRIDPSNEPLSQMMSTCLATTARVGVAPRRGARPLRRVRSLTARAAEEKNTDDKSIPTSLPPDVKTIPAPDVDRNEYTGDWRTGKVWRPPRDANLPKFKVDLGKGTVTIVDEEEERKKYARMRAMNAAAADAAKAAGGDAGPGSLVEEKQIKLRDQGEFILILIPVRAIRLTARVFCLLYPHRQRGHRRHDTRRLRRRHQAHHGAVLQSSPARFPREGTTAERTERARVRRPRQRSDGG